MKIPIDRILVDHSLNVSRESFSPETCSDLAASIGQHGMFTPVCVVPIDHQEYDYRLILGYRRMTAHGILGLTEIEAYVRDDCSEEQAKKLNVMENILRLEPSYWEQCCALRDAFDPELGDTAIAREINKSRPWVRARWLVWRLPPDVIAAVQAGLLSVAEITLIIHRAKEEQQAAADRLIQGKAAGETTQQIQTEISNRRSVRPKKEVHAMMTSLMGKDNMTGVHCLRWTIGEITDTQLLELI